MVIVPWFSLTIGSTLFFFVVQWASLIGGGVLGSPAGYQYGVTTLFVIKDLLFIARARQRLKSRFRAESGDNRRAGGKAKK